jgi:hypothetical protein
MRSQVGEGKGSYYDVWTHEEMLIKGIHSHIKIFTILFHLTFRSWFSYKIQRQKYNQ